MPITLEIDGLGEVEVGDSFKDMSPDAQQSFVNNIRRQASNGIKSGIPAKEGGVGTAFISGVERGAAAIPGIIGDVQELSRAAGRKLGFEPPQSSIIDRAAKTFGLQKTPTSADTIAAASEYLPDVNYKPQTTAEEYASTVGSFLPGSLLAGGGGGLVGSAKNIFQYGVVPGIISEFAGQKTKGTEAEPWARAAGGVAGGMIGPSIANVPGRMISPIRANPDIAGEVSLLESEGVPLTAGQKTGSKGLKWIEATAMDQPLAVRGTDDIARGQGQAFTRAMTKRTGYEQPIMKDQDWQNTAANLGQEYDTFHANSFMPISRKLQGDVATTLVDYTRQVGGQRNQAYNQIVEDYVKDIGRFRQNGGMSGQQYQALREQIRNDIKSSSNSATENALKNILNSIDSEMEQSNPGVADLNRRYATFKALESASAKRGEQTARGYIEPGQVLNEVAKWNKSAFTRGKSEIGNIAQAYEAVGAKLPQSGTQPRTQAQKILSLNNLIPAMVGGGVGGAAGGVPGALLGAAVAEAVPMIMGRAIMSRPVQSYLGNQIASKRGLLSYPSQDQRIRGLLSGLSTSQSGSQR